MLWLIGLLAMLVGLAYRPGVSVSTSTSPTPRSSPTDTGIWFVVGLTDAGPTIPQQIFSMLDFNRIYGGRFGYNSTLYDALTGYFFEGGYSAWIGRVVGPAAVTASHNLLDGVAAISLVASAKGPGAGSDTTHGNSLKVAVLAGVVSGYRIQVLDSASNVLETSGDLTTQQDAVNWSVGSLYLDITIGASANVPVVAAAASLAGGTDDRANIVDAQWQAALDLMTSDLGPGQVSAPGRTTDSGHAQLAAHAVAKNRVAILDLPDTSSAGTLEASAVAARGNGEKAAAFAPWLRAAGAVTGTIVTVPPSALIAGLCARYDAIYTPDQAYGGDLGEARYFTGVSQPAWDAPTRDALNKSSVNVIRSMYGSVRVYGWRSIVDPIVTPAWVDFGNVRLAMAIEARAKDIGESYIFQTLDGAGTTIGHFAAALTAMLNEYWTAGALYGATPDDAFFVDVGPSVNTPTTIANNELHAVLNVKFSPMAEFVQIVVNKVPITQGV